VATHCGNFNCPLSKSLLIVKAGHRSSPSATRRSAPKKGRGTVSQDPLSHLSRLAHLNAHHRPGIPSSRSLIRCHQAWLMHMLLAWSHPLDHTNVFAKRTKNKEQRTQALAVADSLRIGSSPPQSKRSPDRWYVLGTIDDPAGIYPPPPFRGTSLPAQVPNCRPSKWRLEYSAVLNV